MSRKSHEFTRAEWNKFGEEQAALEDLIKNGKISEKMTVAVVKPYHPTFSAFSTQVLAYHLKKTREKLAGTLNVCCSTNSATKY